MAAREITYESNSEKTAVHGHDLRVHHKAPDHVRGSPRDRKPFQQLYNTVDSLVVGNFVGSHALAAVGSTTSIINMIVTFFTGTSVGAGVVISRYYGAHDDEKLHIAVETTMAVTFICGIIFTGLGIFVAPYMLKFMSTPDDVLPSASVYLKIYFSGVFGLLVYNMGSAILRAVGDTKRPLYFLWQPQVVLLFIGLFT